MAIWREAAAKSPTSGKFMDPLADKILVMAALLALIELGSLPSWVALIIVAREFIVSGVRMVAASKGTVISASWYGKFKTVFQMIAIVLFTIKDSYMMGTLVEAFSDVMWVISWIIMAIALLLTVVSMLDYIFKGTRTYRVGAFQTSKAQAEGRKRAKRKHRRDERGRTSRRYRASCGSGNFACQRTGHHHRHRRKPYWRYDQRCVDFGFRKLRRCARRDHQLRNRVKSDVLDVPESIINRFGVVSTQVLSPYGAGRVQGPDLQRSRCRHRHCGSVGGGARKACRDRLLGLRKRLPASRLSAETFRGGSQPGSHANHL